jgi:hypothetical protein
MKIDGLTTGFTPRVSARKTEKKSSIFSVSCEKELEDIKGVPFVSALSALTELQETESSGFTKEQKIRYGYDLIGKLREFQDHLLNHSVSKEHLNQMEQELKRMPIHDKDPLSDVIQQIRQRLAVELAKHRYGSC